MHQSTVIGDNEFFVRRLEPFTALRVFGELQKSILGPFSAALDGGNIALAVERASASLDGATLERLAKLLLNPAYVSVGIDGRNPVRLDEGMVNQTLAGASDVLNLCLFVGKVNFSDFLEKLMPLVQSAIANQQGTGSASPMN